MNVKKNNYNLYILTFKLFNDEYITIGKKGKFYFPRGVYVYVGSGKKNIESRVARHLQKKKKKRWHIDYLTTIAQIVEVKFLDILEINKDECKLAAVIYEIGGKVIVEGFGATDCGCKSHLYFFSDKPPKLFEDF